MEFIPSMSFCYTKACKTQQQAETMERRRLSERMSYDFERDIQFLSQVLIYKYRKQFSGSEY
jgi:hypothetical protein